MLASLLRPHLDVFRNNAKYSRRRSPYHDALLVFQVGKRGAAFRSPSIASVTIGVRLEIRVEPWKGDDRLIKIVTFPGCLDSCRPGKAVSDAAW